MLRLRFKSLIGAVAVTASFAVSDIAKADTLADAMVGAYKHSGLLDQQRALLRIADEDVAIAMTALKPIINWSASVSYFDPGNPTRDPLTAAVTGTDYTDANIGITASLLLYDFGASQFSIDAAKESVLATRQALVGVEQNVLLRAVTAFFNVRRQSEFVALRQNNVRVLTEELRAARDRFDVGEVTRTDVALAEASLAEARAGLASVEGALQQAIEEYRAAVGRGPGQLAPPPRFPRLSNSVDTAKGVAQRKHPDVAQAQHQIAAAEMNVLAAQATVKPNLTLNGQVQLNEGLEESASMGLTLSGPIYQGGLISAQVRRAQAQRDAARGNLHVVSHAVSQNVGNAYAQLRTAAASLEASERQVRAARIAFEGTREEATLGARTTLDVLQTEQDFLDAQANRISASVDQYIAAYTVLASMGMLTAEDLNLGITTYDPTEYYNLVKSAPTKRSRQGRQLDRVLKALGKE